MSRELLNRNLLLPCFFVLAAFHISNAQNGSNPFDLQHRVSKTQQSTTTVDTSQVNPFDIEAREAETTADPISTETDLKTQNPFDVQKSKSGLAPAKEKTTAEITLPSSPKTKSPEDTKSGFLFWSILIMVIILALLFTLYRSLISKVYRAFINENLLKLLHREQGGIVSIPYIFLYVLFFISAGTFIFQLGWYKRVFTFELINLIYCVLGVSGFFVLKHFLLKIIEVIFPVSKEIRLYSFTIVIFSIILGIILTPFNVFIAFAQDSLTFSGIIGALIAAVLVYLFRALRGIFIGSKFLAFHKFHFFMYICTVEIAPVLILVKILLNGANIQ